MVDGAFKDVALSDYKGKYVVLFFYPLDWTFVCPTEIIAFSDAAAKFKEIGAELIGASVDSQHSHLQWINADRKKGGLGGVNFPLLADVSKKIAKAYDVLIEVCVHFHSLTKKNSYIFRFVLTFRMVPTRVLLFVGCLLSMARVLCVLQSSTICRSVATRRRLFGLFRRSSTPVGSSDVLILVDFMCPLQFHCGFNIY